MNNQITTLLILCYLWTTPQLHAQFNCNASRAQATLQGYEANAFFGAAGYMVWEGYQAQFHVPYRPTAAPSSDLLHTISAGTLWLGTYNQNGNLKVAAQTYGSKEYWTGPLNANG